MHTYVPPTLVRVVVRVHPCAAVYGYICISSHMPARAHARAHTHTPRAFDTHWPTAKVTRFLEFPGVFGICRVLWRCFNEDTCVDACVRVYACMECDAMRYSVAWCIAMQCGAVWCGVLSCHGVMCVLLHARKHGCMCACVCMYCDHASVLYITNAGL